MTAAVIVVAAVAAVALLAAALIARQLTLQARDAGIRQAEQLHLIAAASTQQVQSLTHAQTSLQNALTAQAQALGETLIAQQAKFAEDLDRAYTVDQAEKRELMNRVMEFAEVRHITLMSAEDARKRQAEQLSQPAPALHIPELPDDEDAFELADGESFTRPADPDERYPGAAIDDREAVSAVLNTAGVRFGLAPDSDD